MKYEITAYRLREALSDIGMSQQELADKSHIGKSSISHYINGTNEPGNKSAYQLAKVLGVNPTWLMGLDVPKHPPIPDEIIVEYADKLSKLPLDKRTNVLAYIDYMVNTNMKGGIDNVEN